MKSHPRHRVMLRLRDECRRRKREHRQWANGRSATDTGAENCQLLHRITSEVGIAAGIFGPGNVSTIQVYQRSRVVNAGDRNFNCTGDELICASTSTGKRIWKLNLEGDAKQLGGHLGAPPVVAEGDLFVALVIGDALRVDIRTGMVKRRFEIGSTLRYSPVVADGRLYVTTHTRNPPAFF
jgi:outer membrane protein assembly factor BamB